MTRNGILSITITQEMLYTFKNFHMQRHLWVWIYVDFILEVLSGLKINFDTRFIDFDVIANEIKIFRNPFDTDIIILVPELQM